MEDLNMVVLQQISSHLTIIENVTLAQTCRELRRKLKKLKPIQVVMDLQKPCQHRFRLIEILPTNWLPDYYYNHNWLVCFQYLFAMIMFSAWNKYLCPPCVILYVAHVFYTWYWIADRKHFKCLEAIQPFIVLLIMCMALIFQDIIPWILLLMIQIISHICLIVEVGLRLIQYKKSDPKLNMIKNCLYHEQHLDLAEYILKDPKLMLDDQDIVDLGLLVSKLNYLPILDLLKLNTKILTKDCLIGHGVLTHSYKLWYLFYFTANKYKSTQMLNYLNQFDL